MSLVEFNEPTTGRKVLPSRLLQTELKARKPQHTIVDLSLHHTPLAQLSIRPAHTRPHRAEDLPRPSLERDVRGTKSRDSLRNPRVLGVSNRINQGVTQRGMTRVPKHWPLHAPLSPLAGAPYQGKHEYSWRRKEPRRAHFAPIFTRFFFLCC